MAVEILATLGTTAVDDAISVFELGADRKKVLVDELMVVFDLGANRKTMAVDDSTVGVVLQPHMAVHRMTAVDDSKVVAESRAEPQVVGKLNLVGVSSHLG